MVQVSYPGVYIQEKSSGVRTITGVATSIGAFVDNFPRGLLNEAVQCFSFADFEKEFGGIHTTSAASYAVKQFFLNGGNEAFVVRVANDGELEGSIAAVAASTTVTDTPAGAGDGMFRARTGRRIRGEAALNPGAWGNNVLIDVDYDTTDPETLFNVIISEVRVDNGRRSIVRTETFRNLTMEPGAPNNAIEVVNESSRLVQLDRGGIADDLPGSAPFPRPAASGTMGGALDAVPASPIDLTVNAGNGDRSFKITHAGTIGFPALRPLFEQALRGAAASATTTAERALLAGANVKLFGRGTTASPFHFLVVGGRGGAEYDPEATLTIGGAGAADLGLDVSANAQQYALEDGNDGSRVAGPPPDPRVNGDLLLGNLASKTGIFALEDIDLFNILCLPRASELPDEDMRAVYEGATAYCRDRRAFLLIDVNESVASLEAMQTWLAQNDSLRDRNAAVYFPRTFVPDPVNGNRLRAIAASGTVAGLFARTDSTRGVWKAPAGTEARLENVQDLSFLLTDLQNGALNPLGANCLRVFPIYGPLCWGARTLDGADLLASEWKYVPVRRLALFIEESLYRGTKWVVFEPNDEPLWALIRLNVGVFMTGLFRQGAFQGSTAQDAFYVKCDAETTTQADRNLGIVNIEVGFAPLKPAEFVVITIQQIAGDLQ